MARAEICRVSSWNLSGLSGFYRRRELRRNQRPKIRTIGVAKKLNRQPDLDTARAALASVLDSIWTPKGLLGRFCYL